MRIAILETKSLKNGIKEVSEKYGQSAVILRSSDLREHSTLVIGYSEKEKISLKKGTPSKFNTADSDSSEHNLKVTEKKQEKIEKEPSEKKSFKDIGDIVKDEIALLSSRNDWPLAKNFSYKESTNFLKGNFLKCFKKHRRRENLNQFFFNR